MKKQLLLGLLIVIALSGCSISFSKKKPNDIGGFFASQDNGDTWVRTNKLIQEGGQVGSIAQIDTYKIYVDPSDSRGIYLSSIGQGLFYTYDLAKGWQSVNDFRTGTITEIAVDPNNKCTIYISTANNIYRSDDCTRSWTKIYYDHQVATRIYTIAIDQNDSNVVYFGTSRGEIVKSINKGESWETIERAKSTGINRILLDPVNPQIMLFTTANGKVWRRGYRSEVSENLKNNLSDLKPGNAVRDVLFVGKDFPGVAFMATKTMILKTDDYGDSWSKLNLIPPDKKSAINALSVNPQNPDDIYYITHTAFFRSIDGGKTWTNKKIPSIRAAKDVVVDHDRNGVIYLGVYTIEEK